MPSAYGALLNYAPTLGEYLTLRSAAGLSPKSPEQALGALTGSWSWCHIRDGEGQAVAMGRILGDGGWYFAIADMATMPGHQRQGLGRRILRRLVQDVRERAPQGAYLTLVADPPGVPLYSSVGFADVAPAQVGMVITT